MKKVKILLALVLAIGIFLLSAPNIRHYLLSGIVKIPSIVSTMRYQSHLEERNFMAVAQVLNDELKFLQFFSSNENRLVFYLVESLIETYELTELKSEKNYYRQIVDELISKYPQILPLYDIKSDININNQEDIEDLIMSLESQNISYRPIYLKGLINNIIQNKNDSRWCNHYLEESLSDYSIPYKRSMLSIQNGNVALIVNEDNIERISWSTMPEVGKSSLRLGFDNVYSVRTLSLILTSQIGSEVEISGLNMLKNGSKINLDDFVIFSNEAAFVDKNKFIALDLNTKLNFWFNDTVTFDAVEFDIVINPRTPSSMNICDIN
tara:strand:- start:2068 stop:3036 length:969 start_codon:yes stop_codon:yes gene_type:complete